jgi:hypothetical protein
MRQLSFKRHRVSPEIIRHSILLYARFTLSFRDVEEMLAERGLDVSYETVRRWFLKFGSAIAANLHRTHPRPSDHWHLDEMVIVIRRKRYWLWRAVDNKGEVLDFLVQKAAQRTALVRLVQFCYAQRFQFLQKLKNDRHTCQVDIQITLKPSSLHGASQTALRELPSLPVSAPGLQDPFLNIFCDTVFWNGTGSA